MIQGVISIATNPLKFPVPQSLKNTKNHVIASTVYKNQISTPQTAASKELEIPISITVSIRVGMILFLYNSIISLELRYFHMICLYELQSVD